jgi:hypothetical protein
VHLAEEEAGTRDLLGQVGEGAPRSFNRQSSAVPSVMAERGLLEGRISRSKISIACAWRPACSANIAWCQAMWQWNEARRS